MRVLRTTRSRSSSCCSSWGRWWPRRSPGTALYNQEEVAHARLLGERPQTLSLGRYVASSSFGQAVMENWQSEYLQFTLFMLATVWLLQKGRPSRRSSTSRPRDRGGAADRARTRGRTRRRGRRRGGLRRWLYSNSLLLVMGGDLPRLLVRAVGHGLERLQRGADRARGAARRAGSATSAARISGRRRCRTGSRSSSPSASMVDLQRLPAPARLARVQAGRRAARRDRPRRAERSPLGRSRLRALLQALERAPDQPRDVHLGDPEPLADVRLTQVAAHPQSGRLIEPQGIS